MNRRTGIHVVSSGRTIARLAGILLVLAGGGPLSGTSGSVAAQRDTIAVTLSPTDTEGLFRAWRHDDSVKRLALSMLPSEASRLGGMFLSIPEYHDEQRFVIPHPAGGLSFGPVVNVFASPYLDQVLFPWQIEEQGSPGMLVALVVVDTAPGALTDPRFDVYNQLHLQGGTNCLWLEVRGPNWQANISPASGGICDRTTTKHQLKVDRQREPNTGGHDYPPVARIGAGRVAGAPQDEQPLIGVKCLDGWCEIGPLSGWTRRPPNNGIPTREGKIKGWHDEQWLSGDDAGILRPTLRAAVIPVPNANRKSFADFNRRWIHVATIHLDADPPPASKYATWGLQRGRNRIELIWYPDQGVWNMRTWPSGKISARVQRMVHVDAIVPGTARWRWTIFDEGGWFPCGQACCRGQG